MDKKMLTAEEIMNKAAELGYDVTIDDCEEAAELVNNTPMTDDCEFADAAELNDAELENVTGGITKKDILRWLRQRYRKYGSPGKITEKEKAIIAEARAKLGRFAAAVVTAFCYLY